MANHINSAAASLPRIGIIGAGMAGLTAGRKISTYGFSVHLFDKARGPGGRMATRRRENLAFDHGAQYFTARDERFKLRVLSWQREGLVSRWNSRFGIISNGETRADSSLVPRYVGVPRMSALTRHLSSSLEVSYSTRIERLTLKGPGWQFIDDKGNDQGSFDYVIITTPPDQALSFLQPNSDLYKQASGVEMTPCWALMTVFNKRLDTAFDGLFMDDATISWAARNNSKPERPEGEAWVLHGSPAWSNVQLEMDPDLVTEQLLAAFWSATGITAQTPAYASPHRWRYARAVQPLETNCVWDADQRIGLAGDWCMSNKVEGAYLSGEAIADRLIHAINGSTDDEITS